MPSSSIMPPLRRIPRASSRDIERSGSAMIFSKVRDISRIQLTTSHPLAGIACNFCISTTPMPGSRHAKEEDGSLLFEPSRFGRSERILSRTSLHISATACCRYCEGFSPRELSLRTAGAQALLPPVPSPGWECSCVVPGSPHIEASFIRVYLTRRLF